MNSTLRGLIGNGTRATASDTFDGCPMNRDILNPGYRSTSGHRWFQDIVGTSIVGTDAGRVRGNGGNNAAISGWTPPTPDYEVQCDYHTITTVGLSQTGIITRRCTSPNDYCSFFMVSTNMNYRRLTSGTNGVSVTLQSGLTYPLDQTVKVRHEAGTVTVSVNGSVIKRFVLAHASNPDFLAAGQVGFQAFNAPTNTQGCHLDNFLAYPVTDPGDVNVVFEGDSLTNGQNATDETTAYPSQSLQNFASPARYRCSNWGISGSTIANRSAAYASGPALLYDPNKTRNILAFLGGTNDIIQGASAATIQTRLQTYWQAAVATGFRVIAHTIMPTTSWSSGGALDVIRTTVNSWILANAVSLGCTAVVDLAANANLSDPTNPTYFAADGTHLTDTGYGILAGLTGPAIALAV